jgi:hypothetical protein
MKSDYLKFWRVIRYYIKAKYGLVQADLDILLFLYSEKYFSKKDFDGFNSLLSWDKDRFERLRQEGWIENFRVKINSRRAIYGLSIKATRMIKSIYNKLEGQEIPMAPQNNPIYKRNVSYSDKVYRNMITRMNKAIRDHKLQNNNDISLLDD